MPRSRVPRRYELPGYESEASLRGRGAAGFSVEDYQEFLRAGIAKREDEQAHAVALAKMAETGATGREKLREAGTSERLGVTEAGLGRRLGRAQEFERPEQTARIGEMRASTRETTAGAERAEYGLGFEKSLEDTLRAIVGQQKTLGGLDIEDLRGQVAEDEKRRAAPTETATVPSVAPGVAKPTIAKRRLRPSLARELGAKPGAYNPLGSAVYGWGLVGKEAGKGLGWLYDYLYPRSK